MISAVLPTISAQRSRLPSTLKAFTSSGSSQFVFDAQLHILIRLGQGRCCTNQKVRLAGGLFSCFWGKIWIGM